MLEFSARGEPKAPEVVVVDGVGAMDEEDEGVVVGAMVGSGVWFMKSSQSKIPPANFWTINLGGSTLSSSTPTTVAANPSAWVPVPLHVEQEPARRASARTLWLPNSSNWTVLV